MSNLFSHNAFTVRVQTIFVFLYKITLFQFIMFVYYRAYSYLMYYLRVFLAGLLCSWWQIFANVRMIKLND